MDDPDGGPRPLGRPPPPTEAGELDARQRQAVDAGPGPLLVLAGAGSGKTRVLTRRAAALVERGLAARSVLVITFTNRAAAELRARLGSLIAERAQEMTIGTFHAVCHGMLRRHPRRAGRRPGFSIYDGHASRRLIARALGELGAAEQLTPRLVALQIGQAKARLLSPADYRALRDSAAVRTVAACWERYEAALERSNALDFDDLLGGAVALLADADLLAHYRRRFRAVLVDEYQDTNPAQYAWLRRLVGGHRQLAVVADDSQAIFGFRGADVGNVLGFERDFPDARVIALERNYRSSGAIVAAATRLVAHNRRRRPVAMWTDAPVGAAVTTLACADEHEEARAAAAWCRARIERGVAAEQLALLVRTRAQLRPLEDALLLGGIACRVVGGQGLWETQAARDLLAHLTLLVNPSDELALGRALRLRPGVGEVAVGRVLAAAQEHGGDLVHACTQAEAIAALRARQRVAVAAFGHTLVELRGVAARRGVAAASAEAVVACGLAERLRADGSERAEEQLERLRRFCRGARGYEAAAEHPSLADFLAQAALRADEGEQHAPGRVTLSTLHAAKGCEWDHVRIAGLCEDLLPHAHALERGEIEEERRLCYVGVTRARRELGLSIPRRYRGRPLVPSRFLAEAGLARAASGPRRTDSRGRAAA